MPTFVEINSLVCRRFLCRSHFIISQCQSFPLKKRIKLTFHTQVLSPNEIGSVSVYQTQPNRKCNQTGPWVCFPCKVRIRFGSTKADPERTLSGPRADSKRTSKVNPDYRNGHIKRTRGPLYLTELSIRISD